MQTVDFLEDIKILKDFEDTDIYDTKLLLFIGSCINKLKNEGVPVPLSTTSSNYQQFLMCLFHYITLVFDDDVNKEMNEMLYINSVENLRMEALSNLT